MKLAYKKLRYLALMLCCILLINATAFTSDAQVATQVNVIFNANEGQLEIIRHGQKEGPFESWGDMFEVGSTVGASVSVGDVTNWAADRELEGWLVGYDGEITNEDGSSYFGFVQLPGTGLLTTQQALAYTIPADYSPFIFKAQWSGNDADYYSHVYIQGYGAQFTFTDYYWENNEKIGQDMQTEGWGNDLRRNGQGIATQTADYFAFKTEPSRPDATFEGWAEFKVVTNVDEDGNTFDTYELVSDTIYTTADMLAKPIPGYNVAYVAKWSDIELSDYYKNNGNHGGDGPRVQIEMDMMDGTLAIQAGNGSMNTDFFGDSLLIGSKFADHAISFSDPVFWNPSRPFEGWRLCTREEVTDEEGSTYLQYVQVPGSGLMTTTEVLAYEFTDTPVVFVAQWGGDDADYYSQVNIDGYGAEFTFTDYHWENDQKVSQDLQTGGWGNRLKRNGEGIATQAADYFAFKAEPSRPDATFEGWAEFKVIWNVDDNGDTFETYESVSDTIYTTADMLAKPIPDYDVKYVAKWSDIPLTDYFKNNGGSGGDDGSRVQIEMDMMDGNLAIQTGSGSMNIDFFGDSLLIGSKFADHAISFSDPVFWNPSRPFEGWRLCTREEVTDEEGYTYLEYVQVPGSGLMTTAEVLAYEFTDTPVIFVAQWGGDDAEYYSQVDIEGYGANFTFTEFYWENDQRKEMDIETGRWGNRLKKNGESIATQAADYFVFKTDPSRPDATFEGWAEFRVVFLTDENGETFGVHELVSDTIYTTTQMLTRPVPDYNVLYAAKWSDIPLSDYFTEGGEEEDAEDRMIVLNADGGDVVLKISEPDGLVDAMAGAMDFVCSGDETLAEEWKECGLQYVTIQKECSKFLGWKVLRYERAEWYKIPVGAEPSIGDPDIRIEYVCETEEEDGSKCDRYLIMEFCEEEPELLTTDEIFTLKGDKGYYAVAVWEEAHSKAPAVNENIVEPTDKTKGSYESVVYCSECGVELSRKTEFVTMKTQKVEVPGLDAPARIEIQSALTKVPEEIAKKYASVQAVEDAMVQKTLNVNKKFKEKNMKVEMLDVELKVQKDNGTWEIVTPDNFPEEGIYVMLPYPAGTDAKKFDFIITHMISSGKNAGQIEVLKYTKEANGLRVKVTSCSPFMIASAEMEKDTEPAPGTGTTTGNTTGSSAGTQQPVLSPKTGEETNWILILFWAFAGVTAITGFTWKEKRAK